MGKKKNIIFIQCDSMDGRAMGCMGHPAMVNATPNLDRLAQRGVMFKNTYSNSPMCCPSRASMWSGQYTHHCEGWNNFKGLSEDTPTFKNMLEQSGYTTCCFGKTDYLSGYHTIRARVSAWTRTANIMRPNFNMNAPELIKNMETRVHKTDWDIVDRSIQWIKNFREQEKNPFMLYIGLNKPHPKFSTSLYYLNMINDTGVLVPPQDESKHPAMEYQKVNKNWKHGYSKEMIHLVRKIYFAMISEVDAMLGNILDEVERLGIMDDTYVIFSSDHGELAMEHGQYYKMSAYEPSVRVPLIISGPGINHDNKVDRKVSLVDIYPTFMDMVEAEHHKGLDGYSLMPELKGRKSNRPDWIISECHDCSCNPSWFMLRSGEWKYVAYPGYEPQLFNLIDDPSEINNAAFNKPDIVAEMDSLLRNIVDYEKVYEKVKAYDKNSFAGWREEALKEGTYYQDMSKVFSGWDYLNNENTIPWTEKDEMKIIDWLDA